MLGAQLEQMKKKFKPKPFPLKDFPNPKELACFGFNLTNIDIKFNNGFIQVDANYITVAEPNSFICETLQSSLKASPEKILELVKGYVPGMKDKLKDAFQGGDDDDIVDEESYDEETGEYRKRKTRSALNPGKKPAVRGPGGKRMPQKGQADEMPEIQIPEELLREDL